VLPATLSDVRLWAELTDGRRIQASRTLPQSGQYCRTPANPPALPKALQAIQEADYIIIGPGSLYTSVIEFVGARDCGRHASGVGGKPTCTLHLCL